MSDVGAFLITLVVLVVLLALCWAPLGDYIARVFTYGPDAGTPAPTPDRTEPPKGPGSGGGGGGAGGGGGGVLLLEAPAPAVIQAPVQRTSLVAGTGHLRAERVLYRLVGIDADADQTWAAYLRSLLAFSLVSVLGLYALLRFQSHLPLSIGMSDVKPSQAFETAASFVTNTDWQSYAGESTMSHLSQMLGLTVQNFTSAAVGLSVAVALVRGFTRSRTDRLGNFWVDLVRGVVRILLPLSVVAAVVLLAGGVVQDFAGGQVHTTLAGAHQTIIGGPIASQEAIKEVGTNGGGFFNANSAHPFENPNPFTNFLEIFLLLLIPISLTRTFGTLVGDRRQGLAILAAMMVVFGVSLAVTSGFEIAHHGTTLQAAGSAMEGKEVRFGVPQSSLFATATTSTSTGAVDSFHDSYSALGGGMLILNMMFGEVTPGGVGSGLYGILVVATVAVFVAGLMVGRTPEYLGKKIGGREIKFVALYILATPAALLVGLGIAITTHSVTGNLNNPGAHGFSEALYAFTSASNNNGSAFAGITTATTFSNTALGLCMLVGRFLPIAFALGLAGSLARQRPVPVSAGTLPTHRTLFVALLVGVLVIVTALTYFPALALGPLAEGLS